MNVYVSEIRFRIYRLELWWVAFDKWVEFCPKGRKHLRNGWYWNAS